MSKVECGYWCKDCPYCERKVSGWHCMIEEHAGEEGRCPIVKYETGEED